MEPWEEALDVDDSDLHPRPLLRPCKQQRCRDQTVSIISQSQTLDSSPSSSQTVNSFPRNLNSAHQAEPPPQSRTIPGPAGVIQAAKLLKTRDNVNCLGREGHLMATQEYIRKVVEDPNVDDDFNRNPWLSATEFLYADGMFYSASSAHLGEINKYQKNDKLDQVVAVIKSCTPNELGDMRVTLKDPTGTVSGTIHHKILTEGDFRKGICVGSVLILHKVSVFSPTRSTHYLNITKRNLVKVFYKDGGSSHTQAFYKAGGSSHTHVAPHSESNNVTHLSSQDSERRTRTLGSAFSLEQGTQGVTNKMKRSKMNNEHDNINYSQTSNKGTNLMIVRDREIVSEADVIEKAPNKSTYLSSQDSGRGTPTLGSAFSLEGRTEGITNRMRRSSMNNEQENINYSQTSNKGTNLKIARDKEILTEVDVTEKGEKVEQLSEGHANEFKEIKALLTGWTEEQLLEVLNS